MIVTPLLNRKLQGNPKGAHQNGSCAYRLAGILGVYPSEVLLMFFVVVVVVCCFLILTYFFIFSAKIKLYTLSVNHNYITYLDNFLIMTT